MHNVQRDHLQSGIATGLKDLTNEDKVSLLDMGTCATSKLFHSRQKRLPWLHAAAATERLDHAEKQQLLNVSCERDS